MEDLSRFAGQRGGFPKSGQQASRLHLLWRAFGFVRNMLLYSFKMGVLKEHRSMFSMSTCQENEVYVLLGNLLLYSFTVGGDRCSLRVRDFSRGTRARTSALAACGEPGLNE